MFDWLFPTWTNPWFLVLLVTVRAAVNGVLTALVARFRGVASGATLGAASLTLASTGLTVLVLRNDLGLTVSYVEFVLQVTLVVLAGYVGYSTPSGRGRGALLLASASALGLLVVMIPIYGEATVAP